MSGPRALSVGPASTRPSIPVSAWFTVMFWTGIRIAEAQAWHAPARTVAMCAATACAFVAAGVTLLRGGRGASRFVALLAIGLCAGLLVGGLFWFRADAGVPRLRSLVQGAPVRLLADASVSRFGYSVRCGVLQGPAAGLSFSAILPATGRLPLCGEVMAVHGSPDTSAPRDEFARRSHRAGVTAKVRVWRSEPAGAGWSFIGSTAPLRRRLVEAVSRIEGEPGALLQGMLLGERSRLKGSEIESAFRTTGLSHILAVSGTHLVVVAYTVGALLAAMGVSRRARTTSVLAFAGMYVLLTGAPVSAVRALAMTASATAAGAAGRRGDALSGLSVAACAILLASPPQAFDIGFALSVSAVAGLVVFSALATEWARALAGRSLRRGVAALVTPIVAQASTAPVAIPVFNMVSVISPVANLIVMPPTSFSLGVGVVGAALYPLWRGAGMAALRVAAWPLGPTARVVKWLAAVPGAAIPVGGSAVVWGVAAAVCAALLWLVWPPPGHLRAVRVALACLLSFSAWFVADGARVVRGPELVVLDVGQGDAILVRDGSDAVLVDTGPDAATLRAALARVRLRRLDAVLLTHPHADHTGGLVGLDGLVKVERILVPTATAREFESCVGSGADSGARPVETLADGDTLRVGAWTLEVLWPPAELPAVHDCNDSSLVVRVRAPNGGAVVLTGDAEAGTQRSMAGRSGGLGTCDLLKVPHHGSSGSLDDAALAVWQPRVALVSVGEGNEFGHPHPATLDRLRRAGVQVVRTDRSGDIRCVPFRRGFRVSTSRKVASAPESRGGAGPRYATIASAEAHPHASLSTGRIGHDGTLGPFGPQARLPHLRQRGSAARTGDRAPQAPFRRCRGP